MYILLLIPLIPLIFYMLYRMSHNPIWGIVMIFLVLPFESFVPELGSGITIGRLIGAFTMVLWMLKVSSQQKLKNALLQSTLLKKLLFFLLAVFLSSITWSGSPDGLNAWLGAITLLLLGVLALMVETLVTSKKNLKLILIAMAISSAMACIPAMLYILGIDMYSVVGTEPPSDLNEETMRAPTLGGGNPNSLGIIARNGIFASLLLLLIPESSAKKLPVWLYLFLCFGGLVLSGSRTNFYGTAIILAVMAFFGANRFLKNKAQIFVVIVGVLSLGYAAFQLTPDPVKARLLMGGDDERISERAVSRIDITEEQQLQALAYMEEYPIFGVGLDRTAYLTRDQGAHDTVSAIVGETGLLGTVTFILLLTWALFKLWNMLKRAKDFKSKLATSLLLGALISFIVMGVRGGLIIPYDRTFWLVLGLIVPVWRVFMPKTSSVTSRHVRQQSS